MYNWVVFNIIYNIKNIKEYYDYAVRMLEYIHRMEKNSSNFIFYTTIFCS